MGKQPEMRIERSWEAKSGHITELESHAGGLWTFYCRTCKDRSPEFKKNEHDADVEALRHHFDVANGAHQVAERTAALGPAIRHARNMAQRETTPAAEVDAWVRLANDMERQLRTSRREILEGQEELFAKAPDQIKQGTWAYHDETGAST